jgi:hypothetical protein
VINPEDYEPEPDDLTRAELAELAHLPWSDLAETLDEWNIRLHATHSSAHGVGLFLDLLNERGWRVVPLPAAASIGDLLPPPTE